MSHQHDPMLQSKSTSTSPITRTSNNICTTGRWQHIFADAAEAVIGRASAFITIRAGRELRGVSGVCQTCLGLTPDTGPTHQLMEAKCGARGAMWVWIVSVRERWTNEGASPVASYRLLRHERRTASRGEIHALHLTIQCRQTSQLSI